MKKLISTIPKSNLFSLSTKRFSLFTGQQKLELPKLDYGYGDLEPVLSKELLELHHTKHHQTYIDNYNKQIVEMKTAMDKGDLEQITFLSGQLKFNGGSHINHSIYWKNLLPVKRNYNI
jgi:Fe-Mn family superoxide dismutase